MATWQASLSVVFPDHAAANSIRAALGTLLPSGPSWSESIEGWGQYEGDRIEVSLVNEAVDEVTIRLDLRRWNEPLYRQVLEAVQAAGSALRWSPSGPAVPTTLPEFLECLRQSEAARFVRDPSAFLETIKELGPVATGPITMK